VTSYEDEKPIDVCSYDVYSPLNVLREIENLIKAKGETYILSELFEK
jgi:tRNA A58 N-methylase Trm61